MMILTGDKVRAYSLGSVLTVIGERVEVAKRQFPCLASKYQIAKAGLGDTVLTNSDLQGLASRLIVESVEIPTGIVTVSPKAVWEANRKDVIKVSFDFDNLRFAYRSKIERGVITNSWVDLNQYVLLQYGEGKSFIAEDLVDVRLVMAYAAKLIAGMNSSHEVENLIEKSIEGAIVKDSTQYGKHSITKNIFEETVDWSTPQEIIVDHKLYPLTVRWNSGTPTFAKGRVSDKSYGIILGSLDCPVVTDKQAAKYWVYGAGAEALGAYRDGERLISFNPIDDVTKGANRIMAGNFKYAKQDDAVYSNLVKVLRDGSKTATHGVVRQTLIVPAMGIAAQGIAYTNGVVEEFEENKQIRCQVSLVDVGAGYKDYSYERIHELAAEVKNALLSDGENAVRVLQPGDSIVLGETVIYTHRKETTVEIAWNKANINVRPGRRGFGNQPCTMDFVFNGVSKMAKKNAKYRGAGVKATALAVTSESFKVEELDGSAFTDWEICLSSEAFKTSEKVLELYANAHADDAIEIVESRLYRNGEFVSQEDFNNWIGLNLHPLVIRQRVHIAEAKQIQRASITGQVAKFNEIPLGSNVEFGEPDEEGYVWATQEVKALIGYGNYCVEVSTADENYTHTAVSILNQKVLGTFHPKMKAAFESSTVKRAKVLSAISLDNEGHGVIANPDRVINLNDVGEYKAFMASVAKAASAMAKGAGTRKEFIGALKDLVGSSFRLEFTHNNNVWKADVPVEAMLKFCNWGANNNGIDDYTYNENGSVENSVSRVADFTVLIGMVKQSYCDWKLARLVNVFKYWQSHIQTWLEGLYTSKTVSNIVKSQMASYMKVVGDYEIGTFKYTYSAEHKKYPGRTVELPIAYFNSEHPIWRSIKEQDVLLMSRIPNVTAVAVVAMKSDKYDRTMVAIAPSIMARGNRGDFDGDSVSLLSPRRVAGCSSYADAENFNNGLWSLAGYEAEVKLGESDPVRDVIRDIYKTKTATKFSQIYYSNRVDIWQETMVKVNEVYLTHVGLTYGYKFDSIIKLFETGNQDNESHIISCRQAILLYEEHSLGGYNQNSYTKVNNFIEAARMLASSGRTTGGIKPTVARSSTRNKFVRGGGVTKVTSNSSTNSDFALYCAAGLEMAKQVLKGEFSPRAIDGLCLAALAIRNLTLKSQFSSEVNVYSLAVEDGSDCDFTSIFNSLSGVKKLK